MAKLSPMQLKLRQALPSVIEAQQRFQMKKLNQWRLDNQVVTLFDCVKTEYPTLVDIKISHGMGCALKVIEAYLINLCESLNVHRLTEYQVEELTELIYEEAFYLKIIELHEFFKRVRKAKYGELYGSIDTVKLMTDLNLFLSDRTKEYERLKRELAKQKRDQIFANSQSSPMPDSFKQTLLEIEENLTQPKHNIISTRLKEMGIL